MPPWHVKQPGRAHNLGVKTCADSALQAKDADALAKLPADRLTRGTSEIRNWVVLGGVTEALDMTLIDYVPCYRTMAGTGCGMGFASWQ